MKKRMFHKGMAAVLAVSLTTGGALPFMAQTVHAEDTAAEQGQTPEKKSGTVTLEKKNDGTYVFGNEYLKRTFSLSADKVLSTKEITNYRTGTPTVFTPQAGSEEFIINTLESGEIRKLFSKGWYEESLYLLAMLDYVSRVNHVPLCSEYSDIRSTKLDRVVYSSSVLMLCRMTKSEEPKVKARKEAIPEFMRFNIAEADVRNVV